MVVPGRLCVGLKVDTMGWFEHAAMACHPVTGRQVSMLKIA